MASNPSPLSLSSTSHPGYIILYLHRDWEPLEAVREPVGPQWRRVASHCRHRWMTASAQW